MIKCTKKYLRGIRMEDKILFVLENIQNQINGFEIKFDKLANQINDLQNKFVSIEDNTNLIKINVENQINSDIKTIAEQYLSITEKITNIENMMDDIQSNLYIYEAATNSNILEIKKLKAKVN